MKRRTLTFTLIVALLLGLSVLVSAKDDIVVFFDSDVHCSVDGYTSIAALRDEEKANDNHVAVVSCGDFVQGGALGAYSKGQYIIDIMNAVDYDVVTLGNHEFDYTVPVLTQLAENLEAEIVSCNFVKLSDGNSVYAPYKILSYNGVDVAFVGITTPESITKTTPKYYMDENGNYLYDFCGQNLYEVVQNAVDNARKDGAEYVVALSHLGSEYVTEEWTVQSVAKNTKGIDVFLDGHSHSVVEGQMIKNADNKDVPFCSVGTKFENVGKLIITAEGEISTSLVKVEEYKATNKAVDEKIAYVKEQYAKEGDKVLAKTQVDLKINDKDGTRLIRTHETNLGNLCADAYRVVMDADVGLMNGGGIRAEILKGDITYNNILSVLPWENKVCVAAVSGQDILDVLEYSVMSYPEESGGFQHVSGIKFTFDYSIPSPVKLDENRVMIGIEGERRIADCLILDKETGKYVPVDPKKMYTLASISYILKESGDGCTVFDDNEIVNDADKIDTSVLIEYIQNYCKGEVTADAYGTTQNRIVSWSNPFADVSPKDEFYNSVLITNAFGVLKGISKEYFVPEAPLTRAMLVTMLYRMHGEPDVAYANEFSDVKENEYYAKAAVWAKQNEIVTGVTENEFSPKALVTREQMAAIMYRYALYIKLDTSVGDNTNILSYNDFTEVSEYAVPAFQWMCGSGILPQKSEGMLCPEDVATRSEVVVALARFMFE